MADAGELIARLREAATPIPKGATGVLPTRKLYAEAADEIDALRKERDAAQEALRIVQNAAKTLGKAQNSELQHYRENVGFDHKLRAEHESLIERDAQMTDALLRAEAQIETLKAKVKYLQNVSDQHAEEHLERVNNETERHGF